MIHKFDSDSIRILTFDAPKGNLLSQGDVETLTKYIELSEKDNTVKGIILTGKGHSFSTGLDISLITENYTKKKSELFFRTFDFLLLRLFSFCKPVIAAVNGHSIGGGLLVQFCSDRAFIADNCKIKIGLPELALGLSIDELMQHLLHYKIGNNTIISHLLYTAEYLDPNKSYKFGFADGVISQENLLDHSISSIQKLVNFNGDAFALTKQTIRRKYIANMKSSINKKCYSIFNTLINQKLQNNKIS